MDQLDVQTVLAVMQAGSFSQAAELLHVTQPTVSARVQRVEQELGVRLWDRTTRRLRLTPEGEQVTPLMERTAILYGRMREISDGGQRERHLTVGSVHSQWTGGILPRLWDWHDRTPGITWRFVTGHSGELLQRLEEGTLDLAFVYRHPQAPPLVSHLIERNLIGLLASPELAASRGVWTGGDLAGVPLVYLDWGHPFSDWFREEAPALQPLVQVDQAPVFLEILRTRRCVGFIPLQLARGVLASGALVEVPYAPRNPMPVRDVYVVTSTQARSRPVLRSLWEHLSSDRV